MIFQVFIILIHMGIASKRNKTINKKVQNQGKKLNLEPYYFIMIINIKKMPNVVFIQLILL